MSPIGNDYDSLGTVASPFLTIQTFVLSLPTSHRQSAIDNALDGDRIILVAGSYVGGRNCDISFGRSVSIVGASSLQSTTVDCVAQRRFAAVLRRENISVSGLTIRSGKADYGAVFYVSDGTLSLTSMLFENSMSAPAI